jgi:hypothetical protein
MRKAANRHGNGKCENAKIAVQATAQGAFLITAFLFHFG